MNISKKSIFQVLQKVKLTESESDIVSSGILKNIQVFGDQVDIDLLINNPTLQARKKLEVDILKIIHNEVYEKAKININIKIEKASNKISSNSKKIIGVDSNLFRRHAGHGIEIGDEKLHVIKNQDVVVVL